jgi:hypothetical protein
MPLRLTRHAPLAASIAIWPKLTCVASYNNSRSSKMADTLGGQTMKFRKLAFAALTLLAMISISPAGADGWVVEKNETDPFDTSKSTFVAGTTGGNDGFVIRCLEGAISLMIDSRAQRAVK